MPLHPRRALAVLAAAAFLAGGAVSAAAQTPKDDRFLAARDAFRAGDSAKLARIAPDLDGHDLAAYVESWQLRLRLDDADPATVRDFLGRNAGSYVAERLRADWLKILGRRQQWTDFDAEYPQLVQPDQELACYALQSRRARGDATALDEALPLWTSLLESPESCTPLFEALIYDKRILGDQVWVRVRRQVEANKLDAARRTMFYLPVSQTPDSREADQALDRPVRYLELLPADWADTRRTRELAVLAVVRVARADPLAARFQLERIEDKLPPSDRQYLFGQIGWQGAFRHLPEALDWYRSAGKAPLGDEVLAWKVRAGLRALDWQAVHDAIEAMPPRLAAQPEWIYWLGRSHQALGRPAEARALFEKLSGQPSFYGNLADDELGRPISVPPRAKPTTPEEMARVAELPAIRRALALFRLGMRTEGVKEWSWGLNGLGDRDLLAAAEIARRNEIYDRAISAADRTRGEHDYGLRYLAPFSDQVRPAARNQSLDDAWVYGLMRQESRFVTSARSSAGASGLMQLMPATARWVARKIGLRDYRPSKVTDTDVNLMLGTTYLRLVLESLDNHPVLASAAYNAGPSRARKWRDPVRALEGAIYAETIPFSETRDYVKKVMSNAVYYSALFEGRPQSLKSRLGMVPPQSVAEPKPAEDLP